MKICVISNSHAGALKMAWDSQSTEYPQHQVEFFAGIGSHTADFAVEGNFLVTKTQDLLDMVRLTSGGQDHAVLDSYDAIILHGLQFRPYFMPEIGVYSDQVMAEVLKAKRQDTISYQLLAQIRPVTDAPILLGHAPMRAALRVENRGSTQAYRDGIALTNRTILAPFKAELMPQPEETIANGNKTAPEFCRSYDAETGEIADKKDLLHMGEPYGRLVMAAYIARLED